ncbi:MAG: hypothetical protein K6A80_01735 [Saccharofermentans sp.]|nr:hypothetical protein [Saccharofermentans sp.]
MDYKIRENKKSWTIIQKHENVTVTINIAKDICPTRKALDKHLKDNKYIIGGK